MKTIKISIIETLKEIRIEVDGRTNGRLQFDNNGTADKDECRQHMKLQAFDLVYHYSNTALDSRIALQWFNNF